MLKPLLLGVVLFLAKSAYSQELDPGRWAHIPIGSHYLGIGTARTDADIVLDPVIRAENVEMEMDTQVFKYIHSFSFLNKSAQISIAQAQHNSRWSGLLNGVPTAIRRVGLSDPILRFAINLKGAPPLKGKQYLAYRVSKDIETIIGLGIAIQLPYGEYMDDKLINLGTNRFTFRTQLGAVHKRGKWLVEVTGAVWLYTENNDFFGGNKLEQDPLYYAQGHLVHTFKPGRWAGLSIGYGYGGEVSINGVDKDDTRKDVAWALGYGFRILPRLSMKIAYIGTDTHADTGIRSDSIAIAFSTFW